MPVHWVTLICQATGNFAIITSESGPGFAHRYLDLGVASLAGIEWV